MSANSNQIKGILGLFNVQQMTCNLNHLNLVFDIKVDTSGNTNVH